jgi:predicted nucleic acid-binding protein
MNSVVLDASFVVKLLADEPGSDHCRALMAMIRGARRLMPSHAVAEIVEVLRRKLRKGLLPRRQLEIAVEVLPSIADELSASALIPGAVAIADRHGITIYDALYVAAADQAGAVLITADPKLTERLDGSAFDHLILGVAQDGSHRGRGSI